MTKEVTTFNHSDYLPPEAETDTVEFEELSTVLEETAASAIEEFQHYEVGPLTQEAIGNDNKPKNGKNQRIGAIGLDAERQAFYARLDRDADEPILAIAIDLGIPEERALKYYVEWKAKDARHLVVRLTQVLQVLRQRLKLANGKDLKGDSPMKLEFADDDTRVTITPYVKKGEPL